MPRRLIRRYLPDPHRVKNHRSLRVFGDLLHNPNLWHLTRQSVSGAVAIGLFVAFVPLPIQMPLAAILAIALRMNLPISVIVVWVSNPLTMAPLFYSGYKLGEWMLGRVPGEFSFEPTLTWFATQFSQVWQPLLLGCLALGAGSALLGYITVRLLWRLHVTQKWSKRRRNSVPMPHRRRAP